VARGRFAVKVWPLDVDYLTLKLCPVPAHVGQAKDQLECGRLSAEGVRGDCTMRKFAIALGLLTLVFTSSVEARGGRCPGGNCSVGRSMTMSPVPGSSAQAAAPAAAKSESNAATADSKVEQVASSARQPLLRRRAR